MKAERGRRRYLLLSVPEGVDKQSVESALPATVSDRPDPMKVLFSKNGFAVVRCNPADVGNVVSSLQELGLGFVDCSGTMRTIRDRNTGVPHNTRKHRPHFSGYIFIGNPL